MRKMTSRIKARPRLRRGAGGVIAPLVLATALLAVQLAAPNGAGAQDLGTLDPKPLPPLAKPDDPGNPAKELFGRKSEPAHLKSEAIGFYAKGCLASIKAAAEDPLAERGFVNAAIKKKLCEGAGTDRAWLQKVRPYWQHDYHFHVRIKCPDDSATCKHQDPVPAGDGCGKELDWWFSDAVLHPKPSPEPEKPRPPIKMADLPPACRPGLAAPLG